MHPLARAGVLVVVITLVVTALTWPAARLEPRSLPVGVVGATPPPLADRDAFGVRAYASAPAAREAILDREVYGAVAGRTVMVATAASPAVAGALRSAAPPGARVVDVAPGTAADPRVATLPALALPLTLLGIVAALAAVFTARRASERLALLTAAALATGVIGALVTHSWLDALPGAWPALAGAVALVVLAVGATVTGLGAHLGRAGIALGALLMMFVANPWSGLAAAPELLPSPAGAIGQLLPTGAGGDLLRGVAYFDGAGGAVPLLVLATWAAVGAGLVTTASLRRRNPAAVSARVQPAAR